MRVTVTVVSESVGVSAVSGFLGVLPVHLRMAGRSTVYPGMYSREEYRDGV